MPSDVQKIYLLMNKPCGVVCSAVSDSHKTIYELLPKDLQHLVQNAKRGERLHTVGRLDCDTTGLILLTNDGDFSHYLTDPKNKIEKTYKVTLEFPVPQDAQKEQVLLFQNGLLLPAQKKSPEQMSAPARLVFNSPTQALVTVTEGKFHEVRRLFLAVSNRLQSLTRLSFGPYTLPPDLSPGHYIEVEKIFV